MAKLLVVNLHSVDLLGGVLSSPFLCHFLVHFYIINFCFNLANLGLALALFGTSMASQMITQMIEYYQFSCHFVVIQLRQNTAIPRARILIPKNPCNPKFAFNAKFALVGLYY